jgi:hypothetical protein
MERVALKGYTFGVIDVEGDAAAIGRALQAARAVLLGSPSRPPTANEILQLLRGADKSGVVNLSGLPAAERLPFVRTLVPQLARLRERLGHPHWIVIDETQHLVPANAAAAEEEPLLIGAGQSVLHIAERPALVARQVLRATSLFIALGTQAPAALEEFCQVSGRSRPPETRVTVEDGMALAWRASEPNAQPFRLNTATPQHPPAGGGGGVIKAAAGRPANTSTRGLH